MNITPQKFYHWLIFQSRRNSYDEILVDNSLAAFIGNSVTTFKYALINRKFRLRSRLPRWAELYSRTTTYVARRHRERKLTSVECADILFLILKNEWRRNRGQV